MAKPQSKHRPSAKAEETRRALVDAAKEVLRHDGFAAATARTIARRAGCNAGLVFYHFASVMGLLLVALDEVSAERRERYSKALADVHRPAELVDLASRIFEEDLDTGDATLLVEMIAGASSTPGLGAEIKARLAPWSDFATTSLAPFVQGSPLGAMVGADEIAHAVVALYLGLELLSHLDGDRRAALALFQRARELASIADVLSGAAQWAAPDGRN